MTAAVTGVAAWALTRSHEVDQTDTGGGAGQTGGTRAAQPGHIEPPRADVFDTRGVQGPAADALNGARASAPTPDGALRVVSINIHQAAPEGLGLGDDNEFAATLDDVGAYVESIDADVVMVQEVRDDRARSGEGGVPEQFAELQSVLGATDAKFAAAITWKNGDAYGDAIFTRNGVTIDDWANVALAKGESSEPRRLLLADVTTPGGDRVRIGNTHFDHQRIATVQQAAESARIIEDLALTGNAAYADGDSGRTMAINGWLPTIIGGDLNESREALDPVFHEAGLVNVLATARAAELAAGNPSPRAFADTFLGQRIDHLYASGDVEVVDTWVDEVPKRGDYPGTGVTDHRAVVVDVAVA